MDFVVWTSIVATLISLISIYKANKNNISVSQNIFEIVIYSFGMSLAVIVALSLIAYALTEQIFFGLTYDIIRVGVLVGGIGLLLTELMHLYKKFDKK